MDSWQRVNETSLLDKKKLYSNLAIGNSTDTDYKNANGVWEDFEMQNLYDYRFKGSM